MKHITIVRWARRMCAPRPVKPRVVRRHGVQVRLYRRPAERWVSLLAIVAPLVGTGPALLHTVLHHTISIVSAPLLMLYLCIPLGFVWWWREAGVYVSDQGVRNVGSSRKSFTEWRDIAGFVVAGYSSSSACVQIEHPDGTRTPLTAIGRWSELRHVLIPYADALNRDRIAILAGRDAALHV